MIMIKIIESIISSESILIIVIFKLQLKTYIFFDLYP